MTTTHEMTNKMTNKTTTKQQNKYFDVFSVRLAKFLLTLLPKPECGTSYGVVCLKLNVQPTSRTNNKLKDFGPRSAAVPATILA